MDSVSIKFACPTQLADPRCFTVYITSCKFAYVASLSHLTYPLVISSTYPSTSDVGKIVDSASDEPAEAEPNTQEEYRPKIAGAFVLCPLVNGERIKVG